MTVDYAARRRCLHDLSTLAGVDAVAWVPGPNLRYFTGVDFHLSERPTIALYRPATDALAMIVPDFEVAMLENGPSGPWTTFPWSDRDGYDGAYRSAVDTLDLRGGTLGLDDLIMRTFEWLAFVETDPSLVARPLGRAFLRVRSCKTADEVAAIRTAIRISETALARTLDWARPGMTERAIVQRLNDEMNSEGSEGPAFGPTVLTGPKSALPHGSPGDRALGADENLLIDFGATHAGYPADITRTVCLGTPSDEMRQVYDLVLRANLAAQSVAGPGVACGTVDAAARDTIAADGYGDYFTHRTGHGLGLEIHELPQIAEAVEDVLAPGDVFTIEPGIYLPDVGGVRIEDDMLVTETGVESLTSFHRDFT